jgi:hypothetical protein
VPSTRRGGGGTDREIKEPDHRIVPAGSKLAIPQLLEGSLDIDSVLDHIPVGMGAHGKYLST